MSRQDPGAATGTGKYHFDPDCTCGHGADYHAFGTRLGQKVRTTCDTGGCDCARYASGPPSTPPVRTSCPHCGAPWSPIEAARSADGA